MRDSYLLCVLSVLAEHIERVKQLFLSEEVVPEGIFAVRFTKNGLNHEVILDDWFPSKDGQLVFAKANGPELWVLLLEKAWAKTHGSYQRIENGSTFLTFRDITGAPSYEFHTSQQNLWEIIC